MPSALKVAVRGIVIRYVLKYGSGARALRKVGQNLPERTEMSVGMDGGNKED